MFTNGRDRKGPSKEQATKQAKAESGERIIYRESDKCLIDQGRMRVGLKLHQIWRHDFRRNDVLDYRNGQTAWIMASRQGPKL